MSNPTDAKGCVLSLTGGVLLFFCTYLFSKRHFAPPVFNRNQFIINKLKHNKMELKEYLEKQESFQRQERTARQNYVNACTKERTEHRRRMNEEMDEHHSVMANLKETYENQLEAIRAERKAVRLEWAESEAKRLIDEQNKVVQ